MHQIKKKTILIIRHWGQQDKYRNTIMRKSIDTYIQAIAHDNEQTIIENGMTIAEYIINDAENGIGYYEFFDDDELDETGEPSESQIEELKEYLNDNYSYC